MNDSPHQVFFDALTAHAEAGDVPAFVRQVQESNPGGRIRIAWPAQSIQAHRALFLLLLRTNRLSGIHFWPKLCRNGYTISSAHELVDNPRSLPEIFRSACINDLALPIMFGLVAEGFEVTSFHAFVTNMITRTLEPVRNIDHPARTAGTLAFTRVEIVWQTPLPFVTA